MNSQESAPNIHGGRKEESGCKCWRGEPGPVGVPVKDIFKKTGFESPEERERILAEIAESTRRRFYPGFFLELGRDLEQQAMPEDEQKKLESSD